MTVNTYDKNGNLVRSVTDGTEITTREWNGFGQQTSWSDGTTEVLFRYRPDGLRHSKQVLTGSGANGTSFLTIHYWDGQNVIGEAAANGTMKALYYRTGNDLTAQQISDDMSFYLYNAHGDVTERVNGNGIVLKSYKYDSFGNIMNPAVVGNPLTPIYVDQSPFGYCGEYLDKETGEVYLRARYYDPASGRFNAEDPLGDTVNLYSYCGNDPVNYVDPTGLRQETEGGGRSSSGSGGGSIGSSAAGVAVVITQAVVSVVVSVVTGGGGTSSGSGGGTPTPSVPQTGQQSEIPWDFTMPRNYVPSSASSVNPGTPSNFTPWDFTQPTVYNKRKNRNNLTPESIMGIVVNSALSTLATTKMGEYVSDPMAVSYAMNSSPSTLMRRAIGDTKAYVRPDSPLLYTARTATESMTSAVGSTLGGFALDAAFQIIGGEDPQLAVDKAAVHTIIAVLSVGVVSAFALPPAGAIILTIGFCMLFDMWCESK